MDTNVATMQDIQKIATVACESYTRALEGEGLLNQSAESILTQYSIVVYEKGWFSKFVDSFFKTGDGLNFRTVKHIIHVKKNDNNNDPKNIREAQILSILDRKNRKED